MENSALRATMTTHWHNFLCGLLVMTTLACATTAWAQLPSAQLHALNPPGGRQGTIVEARIAAGADSEGADRLVFSHPHITAVQKTRPPTEFEQGPQGVPNEFTVAIHPDVPPGVYEARYAGRFGVSNPRAFVVGKLPEIIAPADHHTPEKAVPVALNTVVNGVAAATANDFYKVALKKDQRIVVDCWAERLDSRMDATLAIYDSAGRELALDRDTNFLDPLLVFTAPADGDYLIKVYDFLYRGGNDYFYRLLVSTGPYVDFVFPPVAVAGTKSSFTVYGSNLPGGVTAEGVVSRGRNLEQLTVEIEAPADDAAGSVAINNLVRSRNANIDGFEYRLVTPEGESNPYLIGFASGPIVAEQEPNNDSAQPQEIAAPATFVGRFAPRGDYDWISFNAKKGETFWIDALSQRLGLPTDPYLLVQRVTRNDKGEIQATDVQEVDDTAKGTGLLSFRPDSDDPTYRFVAPEEGTYRVLIRDLYAGSRGDPRLVYALAIRAAKPDFRVVAVPASHTNNKATSTPNNPLLRRGGTEMIDVVALRRDGFNEDIEVTVEGLPAGITASKGVILAGQDSTTLVLRATDDAPGWLGPIRVVGKAMLGEQALTRVARSAAVEWAVAENLPAPARLTRDLWLNVLDVETAPFLVELGEDKTWEMSRAGKLEIPVKVVRRGEMKQPVTLTPVGLPANVKAAPITVAPEASEGKLALEIAEKAKPGVYGLRLQANAAVPYRRDPQSAEAAYAVRQTIEKIAADRTVAAQAADQAKQAADKAAEETAAAAKAATEAAQAEVAKATAASEAAKAATTKATQAREAAEKAPTNQDLVQAKEAAEKAATEAMAQAQTAGAAQSAAEKAAAAATAAAQAAAADKAVKEKVAAEAAAKAKSAADAKAAADKRSADLAKAAEQKNVNVFETSTTTIVKITPAPLTLSAAPAAALAPGAAAEVPITVARLYGFAEAVDVELVVPEKVKGLSAPKVTIPGDQTAGKFAVTAAAEAPAGKHTLTARTKFKFNGQDIQVDQPFTIEIAPAK